MHPPTQEAAQPLANLKCKIAHLPIIIIENYKFKTCVTPVVWTKGVRVHQLQQIGPPTLQ